MKAFIFTIALCLPMLVVRAQKLTYAQITSLVSKSGAEINRYLIAQGWSYANRTTEPDSLGYTSVKWGFFDKRIRQSDEAVAWFVAYVHNTDIDGISYQFNNEQVHASIINDMDKLKLKRAGSEFEEKYVSEKYIGNKFTYVMINNSQGENVPLFNFQVFYK